MGPPAGTVRSLRKPLISKCFVIEFTIAVARRGVRVSKGMRIPGGFRGVALRFPPTDTILERDSMLTLRRSSQPKILAVEDDEGILTVYRDFLKKSGYEVICATDGSEAINLLKAHPDTRLILLDLHLPGISGHELIELFDEQGRKTPVIVTSARGDILSVTRDRKSTAALSKPFQMEELRDLIELLLSSDWQEKLQVDKTEH